MTWQLKVEQPETDSQQESYVNSWLANLPAADAMNNETDVCTKNSIGDERQIQAVRGFLHLGSSS